MTDGGLGQPPRVGENANDQVVLVDSTGRATGFAPKMAVHRSGELHRAFSIFIFHPDRRVMLQQRALTKYHSGMLWSNACCSHPRPDETVAAAAHRRLREEMGFDCTLEERFSFVYRAELDQGLTEHEFDHVLTGVYDGPVVLNTDEAAAWRWASRDEVDADLAARPEHYTVWFRIAWREMRARAD